jgi:hypothetical protein
MSIRLTRNSWEGGLNTDTDKSKLDPIFYTAAHNLDTVGDGSFFALKNIQGTDKVKAIVNPPDTTVLGAFAAKFLITSEYKQCVILFTMTGPSGGLGFANKFKIWLYDTEDNNQYELFQEDISADYITDDRVVTAVGFAENNVDHIYFTDHYNEIRQIRCEIPAGYVANYLRAANLSVQRLGTHGLIQLDSILTGGSLLSGAYQFAYRMVDPVNKRFTKWSSLTLPIHVYSAANSTAFVYADYGLPTEFKIRLDITLTDEEYANWDYFQLAVVENVYPTGPETIVDGQNQTFVASVLPVAAVVDYKLIHGDTILRDYDYKTNTKVGVIPIEELVVDHASIKTVKTLNVKQKRLIGGNVEYHDFEFDNPNGDPVITSGSVITQSDSSGDLFSSHANSLYRGYFRDEVYRFGIVYFDKYGNRSPVKVLDLNGVTNNQISTGIPDMRFPSRSTSNSWGVFNSSDQLQSLGLRLTSIKNHPTWAVGFEIVRAKRIKRVLSQTPVIPMTYVQGVGALGVTVAGGSADNEYTSAQPQTTDEIYMPKNLFWPDQRVIRKNGSLTGSGVSTLKRNEAKLERNSKEVPLAMIFPQNYMYGSGPFQLNGSEKLETVDYCALRAQITDYTGGIAGDSLTTKIKANFYALDGGDYYFDPAWVAKVIAEEYKIKGYVTFNNLGEPTSLDGKNIMDYAALVTEGVDLGFAPKIQKSVVIDVPTAVHDIMTTGTKVFANAGTKNATASGVAIFSSNGALVYQNSSSLNNNYINEYSGYSDGNSYIQAIKIANIVNNYEDDRYGDIDDRHEFISTGAKIYFTFSQLTDVRAGTTVNISVDVWGGDCFVSPHTFKITDGAYSVVNSYKGNSPASADSSANLITKWGKYFLNTSGAAVSLPVGVEAAAQFVTVVLESEYNGGVMAEDMLIDDGNLNGMPIPVPSGEESLRAPLTYRYNINLSKQNDEKVYFPRPAFNFEKHSFPARIIYSDQKIYNTDSVGFDIFRVLNFLDLEEKNGEITKLSIERDNLYAIQEEGVIGLPVGETQVTTTDAGQLSVGTSDFFGRPIVIDNKRGSQHILSIAETGEMIYVPDHRNKTIYGLAGNRLQPIVEKNETLFRSFFDGDVSERNLFSIYDSQRGQYWIANNGNCYLFNEDSAQWKTNLEFPSGSLRTGVYTNQDLFLVGMEGEDISIYKMYKGNANVLFDATVTPRVTFVVNPDDPIAKKFTNQAYISTERLATADFTIEREQELSDQSISGTVIAVSSKGGNYRIKLSRAAGNERLRGLRLITTIKWKTDNLYSSLSQVLTKYQHESRVPF